jgi:hypothetical protein
MRAQPLRGGAPNISIPSLSSAIRCSNSFLTARVGRKSAAPFASPRSRAYSHHAGLSRVQAERIIPDHHYWAQPDTKTTVNGGRRCPAGQARGLKAFPPYACYTLMWGVSNGRP